MKKTETRKKSIQSVNRWFYAIPLGLMVLVVPLIVHLKKISLIGASYDYWKGEVENYDFFSYNKMVWILVFSVITLAMVLYKLYKDRSAAFKKTVFYLPLGIFALFIILSTLASKYTSISLYGFVDRYEGMYVLLSYLLMVFAGINLVNTKEDLKLIIYPVLTVGTIIALIGAFQYLNMDLFKTSLGKIIMLPPAERANGLSFNLGERAVYSTLYHYNYVGSFMAMLFPLALSMFLFVKNKGFKYILGFITLLSFATLIVSKSRAGIIGVVLALVVLLIMCRRYFVEHKKLSALLVGVFVVLFIVINISTGGVIVNRMKGLFEDVESLKNNTVSQAVSGIKNIEFKNGKLDFIAVDNTLMISCLAKDKQNLQFQDQKGKVIYTIPTKESGVFKFNDDRYKDYSFKYYMVGQTPALILNRAGVDFYFAIKDGKLNYSSPTGVIYENKKVESIGFEGKETVASARAYIWSRSLPLLKSAIFIGYGPDTFAIYFPQHDYMGKLKAYGYLPIVDKPHNIYLQTALSTGVISLVAELVLFLMYIVSSFKLYFKGDFKELDSIVGLGIFTAVLGYLGAGVFNDSVVSVAPVFWVLLGTGISINLSKIRKN